jgi:hypothetical protein
VSQPNASRPRARRKSRPTITSSSPTSAREATPQPTPPRTLQRAERTLAHTDAGAVSAATRKMILEADRNELAVLIEELPSMFEAKGIGPEVAKQAKAKGPTKIGRPAKSTARQRE